MEPDFSGYATKAGLKCSDGRTITPEAFQHCDKKTVPLVWQHGHGSPENILGHATLEARADGVYAYGYFNETTQGQNAKALVEHGDITAMSIYANQFVEKTKQVFHGVIREVSLVLSGANPGALIDNVNIAHADGEVEALDDEVIIYTGLSLEHASVPKLSGAPSAKQMSVKDIYDGLTDEQKNVVHYMIGAALAETAVTHGDGSTGVANTDPAKSGDLNHTEGSAPVARNVFENAGGNEGDPKKTLSHEDVKGIVADAMKGGSLKEAVEAYALKHGIEDIDVLFPDAKAVADRPEFDKRRTEWVAGVLSGARHTPFSRIKSLTADLTLEAARAKGYIKGNMKKEEFFKVSKRVTGPTTIYKKQKLDRDDIVDITDFDVVGWLKGEMRLMLDEELARAILVGDGREVDDEDKINEDSIRPIATDAELYVTTVYVNIDDADSTPIEVIDALLLNRAMYKGTGTPTFYTTEANLTYLLLARDTMQRRLFRNVEELAQELRVAAIVPVEAMEDETDLVGIMVNLADYTIGADRGGDIAMFDDFDIDYNQYKYLMEVRVSGALTKIKAALVVRKVASGAVLAVPTEPTFVSSTNTITIPTVTGVTYKNGSQTVTGTVIITEDTVISVVPTSGSYYFATSGIHWTFEYSA